MRATGTKTDKPDHGTGKPTRQAPKRDAALGERLVSALSGRDQAWLARETGLSTSTIGDYVRGAVPAADRALKIARALNVSVEWLIEGTPPVRPGGALRLADESDWIYAPRINPSMFLLAEKPEADEIVPIRKDVLARHISNLRDLWVTYMPGDALPSIADDDELILCRYVDDQLEDGRPYILRLGDTIMVRRVFRTPEGLVLRAEGELYKDITITPDRVHEVRPIGRILGSLALRPAR